MLKKWFKRIVISIIVLIAIVASFVYIQKDNIKSKAINGINEKLNAKVSVDGKIDVTFFKTFPNITLELEKIFIQDKFNSKDTLAHIKTVNFSINPLSLLSETMSIKSIILKNGILRLKTLKNGQSNYDILKKKKETETGANLNLEEIIIENIDLIYDDLKSKVYINTFIEYANFSGAFYKKDFNLEIDLKTKTKSLIVSKTNFLHNNYVSGNFDIFYKANNKCISFKENNINIDGNIFNIIGDICSKSNTINLKAKAKGNKLENALNLIPEDLFSLNGIKGKGKYEININISEKLNKPRILLDFNLENATAFIKKLDINITDIYASGTFKNFPKNNLSIKDFSLKNGKTNLRGNLLIPDLKEKQMKLKVDGAIYANTLKKFNNKQISINAGKIKLSDIIFNFNYRAKDSLWVASKFLGNFSFNDIKGHFNKFDEDFSLNGELKLIKRKIRVKELYFNIGKNDVFFSGFLNNALNYFQDNIFKTNDALVVNGVIKSQSFDINDFLKNKNIAGEKQKKLNLLKWLNIESNVDLEIKKLVYKKLTVENIYSQIKSKEPGLFSFKDLKATLLNGKANGNVEIRFFNNKVLEVFIDAKVKKIDIENLFYSFNNFGQKTITNKNIKGYLSSNFILSMSFKNFVDFQEDELLLQSNFTLYDGELIKLKSLQSLAKYLSVEQLEHIYFSKYESSISIVNKLINLKSSKIKSNLISLKIGGSHTFSNKIDYNIKLNLKNLLATKFKKKKTLKKDYINDEKGGINIFIKMKGNASNPTITMDRQSAFNNWQKDLKEEKQNIKDLFKKDIEFFEEKETLYFEDDKENYLDFENE